VPFVLTRVDVVFVVVTVPTQGNEVVQLAVGWIHVLVVDLELVDFGFRPPATRTFVFLFVVVVPEFLSVRVSVFHITESG
jgi:hypothetical protein